MKPPPLSPLAYRRLCLVAVVALASIVVTGGAVRLTGSGLGCSTWPQCEPGSYTSAIAFRPLVEFGNRMVTIAVGVITAAPASGLVLDRVLWLARSCAGWPGSWWAPPAWSWSWAPLSPALVRTAATWERTDSG